MTQAPIVDTAAQVEITTHKKPNIDHALLLRDLRKAIKGVAMKEFTPEESALTDDQKAAIAAFFNDLSPKQMAQIVGHWTDEQQADLFIELAKVSLTWDCVDWRSQWWMVGRHLRTCTCTTADAQLLIDELHHGLTDELRPYERTKMLERGLDPDAACPWEGS